MNISLHRRADQPAVTTITHSMTLSEVMALPAITDVVSAGKALGIGRTRSYELARTGSFPCRVVRIGKTYHVPTANLLALLGVTMPARTARGRPTGEGQASQIAGLQVSEPKPCHEPDPGSSAARTRRTGAATRSSTRGARAERTQAAACTARVCPPAADNGGGMGGDLANHPRPAAR
jgi:hypothetical protein